MHLRGGISATVQGWNQLYMGLQNHFHIVEDYWTSYLFTWVIMIKIICIWLANNSNSLCQCITLLCHLKALQSEPPECYWQPPSGFAEHTITASLVCYILSKSNVGPCYWSVWATDYGNSTCCIGAIHHNILDIKEAQYLNRKGQRWFAGAETPWHVTAARVD